MSTQQQRFAPTRTANGQFLYTQPLLHHAVVADANSTSHFWDLTRLAGIAHRALWDASNWGPDYKPLPFGSFGLDNMVCSVGYALALAVKNGEISSENEFACTPVTLRPHESKDKIEIYASAVHDGWCANYTYWASHPIEVPWRKPFKAFDGEEKTRREACLVPYTDLPEDEKIKDRVIARAIVDWIAHVSNPCDCVRCCVTHSPCPVAH